VRGVGPGFLLLTGEVLLETIGLGLAITFVVHLSFVTLPPVVESSYGLRRWIVAEGATTGLTPVERLKAELAREFHTAWLRRGAAARTAAFKRLLEPIAQEEMTQIEKIRAQHSRAAAENGVFSGYWRWLVRACRADLGVGRSGQPVTAELRGRLGVTAALALGAYLLAGTLGMWIALLRVAHEDRGLVSALNYLVYLWTTLPAFFLGYFLTGALRLDLSRSSSLALPTLTLALSSGVLNEVSRIAHHALREQFQRNYMRTARVKGLRRGTAMPFPGTIAFHAFRQAVVEFLPRLATRVPMVLGMSILVERVFVLPGLGDMLIDGLASRDETRVLIVVLLAIVLVEACRMITRVMHLALDPRAHRAVQATA